MTYTKPGFYEVPAGALLPNWCATIAETSTWARDLSLTLNNLGRAGRRVSSISLEDVIALKGEGQFVENTAGHRALCHVLLRFLFALGLSDRYPRVIGYKNSPYLSLEECVDRMMSGNVIFPTLDSLGGKEGFNLEALKGIFPTIVRELRFQRSLRNTYFERLQRKLGSIAFKLATGQPIDQAERSFYVAFSSPDDPMGWTRYEKEAGVGPKITIAESGDPLVAETWELYKKSTEAGPFLKFLVLHSNTNMENLVFWYGPQQAALSWGMGYRFGFGDYFDEPRVREAVVLPWQSADQLVATRERNVAFNVGDSSAVFHTPVLASAGKHLPFNPTWDLPDVNIRVRLDGDSIAANEYSYWSNWRERIVSTRLNASPQTLLTDLALSKERIGEGQSTGLSIQSWDLIDLTASRKYLGDHLPSIPTYNETITIPGVLGAAGREVRHIEVPMADFYQRLGTTMFPPAFKEFVMVPMSWLHVPDPEAEEFIAARFGLTWEQKQQAVRSIRISHNYSKLVRLLSERQMPISQIQMQAMCKAIMGGS